ncbi:Solute carrier family 22 member 14 [Plecturocebus cupreus]
MVRGEVKEAKQVLCYAASVNKTIPANLLDELQLPRKKVTKASVLDFCKNRQLCKVYRQLHLFCIDPGMRELGMSLYFGHVVLGVLKVPARLCCFFLLQRTGRKWSLAVALLQVVIWCLVLLLLPEGLKSVTALVLTLGEVSLAAAATLFFLHTAECLPTVLSRKPPNAIANRISDARLGQPGQAAELGFGPWNLTAAPALHVLPGRRLGHSETQGNRSGAGVSGFGGWSRLVPDNHQTEPLPPPIFSCCISAIVGFSVSFLLPETQDQCLSDSLDHSSQMGWVREAPGLCQTLNAWHGQHVGHFPSPPLCWRACDLKAAVSAAVSPLLWLPPPICSHQASASSRPAGPPDPAWAMSSFLGPDCLSGWEH